MTDFFRPPQVPVPEHFFIPAALGASPAAKLTSLDRHKLVKLDATTGNYVLTASGNDIEGQLVSVEAYTVNEGFGRGAVQNQGTLVVTVDTAPLAINAYVVSGPVSAVGTALPFVASGPNTGAAAPRVIAGAGAIFRWRVCSLLGGAGAVNSQVLIERVV